MPAFAGMTDLVWPSGRIHPIERHDRRGQAVILVEAAPVDADRIGVRARAVEALDAAMLAEQVPRPARAEAVKGEVAAPFGLAESSVGHDQMKVAGHAADRAITVEQFDVGTLEPHLEADMAAMAAAFDGGQAAFRALASFFMIMSRLSREIWSVNSTPFR